jgi:hypothetical protein
VTPHSTTGNRSEPYSGSLIAVGTNHGKQHQFAPAFSAVLGARLVTPPGLDTDQFGTFSVETPRSGTAVQAARSKARLALTLLDLPRGVASEASYGPLPGGWFGHQEDSAVLRHRARRRSDRGSSHHVGSRCREPRIRG